MSRLFGTDGVRGVANRELTPELALRLGQAGALVLAKSQRPRILIGMDTRISSHMLEAALIAGFTSVGADVYLLGVLPTPAVAVLTKTLKADAGVMISASHNPVEDNGIKFFSRSGLKLPDDVEDQIEAKIAEELNDRPVGSELGRVFREEKAGEKYLDFLLTRAAPNLQGMHIAVDCANGASSAWAPELLRRLGARLTVVHDRPDGTNINVNCGSTHPAVIQRLVVEVGADLGITYDGDADRVIAVDEKGRLVTGDHILAICGLHMLKQGALPGKKIAATVYSNGGLDQVFAEHGGSVVRTKAGDRYVLEAMVEQGLALGGEQSGHVIFLNDNTTGDGMLTTLKLLTVLIQEEKPLSQLADMMPIFPQELVNVRVADKRGWEDDPQITEAIDQARQMLGADGRILVRASGTEPLIRVMVEHPSRQLVEKSVKEVTDVIRAQQGE